MLTTRCPHCQTTFRITSVALHKAAGQVRCGQCSTVFSAFDSLTDTMTRIAVDDTLQSTVTEAPERTEEAAETMPAQQIFEVLEESPPEPAAPWHPIEREAPADAKTWRSAAAIAAVALLLQGTHHFRGSIASAPWIGNSLERVYSALGMPIIQDVDPAHFTIVDWVATAGTPDEAGDEPAGSLAISAGVRNTSTEALPYPLLSLELTNRWEDTIGARVFMPDEYMGTRLASNARIRPNTTVTAQLQLVDPGPDAYGFEVDICVAVDEQRMRCKSDAVFQ
ncbi:MAG: zinc-ribbon and DUF3426 domain-containing protein [Gammaproteobacteria bacterium]|jgi:predicted Zn finger-like uncharacterized protein